MTTEIDLINETLTFNDMPPSARRWLNCRKTALLRMIAANQNGAA